MGEGAKNLEAVLREARQNEATVVRAAAAAALRPDGQRLIGQSDLGVAAAAEGRTREGHRVVGFQRSA